MVDYDSESNSRDPIIGRFEPTSKDDFLDTPAHVGFDRAWQDALDQAGKNWRRQEQEEIEVTVEYEARIDFWNPGGIGQYSVKITPTG